MYVLKRKIRNYVALTRQNKPPNEIYFFRKGRTQSNPQRPTRLLGETPVKKKLPKDAAKAMQVTAFMCSNFYDIRTFGAVMSTR